MKREHKVSKRFKELKKLVERTKVYSMDEAIALVKSTATTKFDSAIEVHFNLGIDPKKGEQQVRATVVLPHGSGKSKKIAAFVDADKAAEARSAGADLVGGQELIDEIKKSGKCDFEIAVATPDMMKNLAGIAKILGPKGLMPSPKNETITVNIKKTVEELKKGKIAFKNDATANLHQVIGKASFSPEQLKANLVAFLEALDKAKPESTKGTFVLNATITSTMGPGIRFAIK
jgi:large subunit ribosomal protein L1